jgi:deoxyribonuclease V
MREGWPSTAAELVEAQERLADEAAAAVLTRPWRPYTGMAVAGCFVAYAPGEAGPGRAGDRAWAAAVTWRPPAGSERRADRQLRGSGPGRPRRAADVEEQQVVEGRVPAAYVPGLLTLREGPIMAAAVTALATPPDLVLVDATGRDHPRRAGLAVHLGAVLDLPTVGVTRRPLVAVGDEPSPERGASAPVVLGGEVVGAWVRTATGVRPVVAHAGWRTDPATAVEVVLACSSGAARTPIPLQEARRVAREVRAAVSA